MLRPAVPNCCTGDSGSGVICWKAALLSQAVVVLGPALGFCPGTRFGRFAEKPLISGAPPCCDTSVESKTVNGVPVITLAMPFNCQAPRMCWYQPWGRCHSGTAH